MLPSVDELKERYSRWPNERLLSVLHHKEEYTRQAVEVAREELGQRNLTVEDVDVFLEQLDAQRLTHRLFAAVPLSFLQKALCFFVWFAPSVFRINYESRGYVLKAKQSQRFSMAGLVLLLADASITTRYDLRLEWSILLLVGFFLLFGATEEFIRKISRARAS